MAGTIYGLSLSQVMDSSGRPLVGAKVYLYEANSTTPVTSYQTALLTPGQENPWPVLTDSNGRIPSIWLEIGAYHVLLTDANDAVQFEEQYVETVYAGAVEEEYPEETPTEGFTTGDIKFRLGEEALTGWLPLNGMTLGNANSGAANASNDYQDLFVYLWTVFPDSICAVSGGRFTAIGDFEAGKTIAMLDLRGRLVAGLDDMGNAAAGRLGDLSFSPGDAVTGGSLGGFLQAGSPGIGVLVGTWYIRI